MANIQRRENVREESSVPEVSQDLNADMFDALNEEIADDENSIEKEDKSILFAKSTDVRRRIEEKLEVKVLRDELGIDDFDL